MTLADWRAEAMRRFGPDPMLWRFVCPSCGHVTSVKDWRDAGATECEIAFSCVGRHLKKSGDIFGAAPCNYAGGGLFKLNPQPIIYEDGTTANAFAFDKGDSFGDAT
jgi:hypothetical protein